MKKLKKILLIGLLLAIVVPIGGLFMMNLFSKPPGNLGVTDGQLSACPKSPNCVSTQTDSTAHKHKMEPVPFDGAPAEVVERLKTVIGSMARAKITEESEGYIRAEFTTAIMRYVDDVELLIDDEAKLIHFRSASRVGYSDMGANRKRMTMLFEAYRALQ